MYSRLGSEIGGKLSFIVASISTDASSPLLRLLRGPCPWSRCGRTCRSSARLVRKNNPHIRALALSGSIFSFTRILNFPEPWFQDTAPLRNLQLFVQGHFLSLFSTPNF